MGKIKHFFKTLGKKDFLEFILKYIRHPFRERGKLNEEIKRLKGEIAISDDDLKKIEQLLGAWYNSKRNDYSKFKNENSTWLNKDMAKTQLNMSSENDIPDCRGVLKSFNLPTGEISHILNGVKFPEKSLNFKNEYRNINGKDIKIVNINITGTLSISSNGIFLLDGQPLEMNQNVKNRLAHQIEGLNGQNARLSFNNGEFSILPRVQAKNPEMSVPKHTIRQELALPKDERNRLARSSKNIANKIKEEEENGNLLPENVNTGELINEI